MIIIKTLFLGTSSVVVKMLYKPYFTMVCRVFNSIQIHLKVWGDTLMVWVNNDYLEAGVEIHNKYILNKYYCIKSMIKVI